MVEPPFVLGHEPGGVVVEVGENVKHLAVGDRVALEPGKTCGHCEFCKQGKYNLCPDVIFFATPPVDGVFQEYVAHEADLCFKLPDNVSKMCIRDRYLWEQMVLWRSVTKEYFVRLFQESMQ